MKYKYQFQIGAIYWAKSQQMIPRIGKLLIYLEPTWLEQPNALNSHKFYSIFTNFRFEWTEVHSYDFLQQLEQL